MTEPATAFEPGSTKAPDAYRTISEVAHELALPQHVLRFWESRFGQIRPLKRGGGRRYYKPEDIALLKGIQHLLYNEGYTIKGVQKVLKTQGIRAVQNMSGGVSALNFTHEDPANDTADIVELHAEPAADEAEAELSEQTDTTALLPEVQADLANQLPLFEQPAEAIPASTQQMAEFAKRLRGVKEDLLDIRAQLKKSGE